MLTSQNILHINQVAAKFQKDKVVWKGLLKWRRFDKNIQEQLFLLYATECWTSWNSVPVISASFRLQIPAPVVGGSLKKTFYELA